MHLIYLLSVEGYCTSVGFMGLMEAPRNPSRNRRDQAGSPSCMKPAMEKGVVSWPASITASSLSKFLEDVWWWLLHGFLEKLVSCEGFGEFWCRICRWHNTDKHRSLNTWLQRYHKSHLQARNTWLLRVLWCLDVTLKPALICFMCTFSFCLNWGVSCLSARNRTGLSQLIPHSISADTCDTRGCDDSSLGGVMWGGTMRRMIWLIMICTCRQCICSSVQPFELNWREM